MITLALVCPCYNEEEILEISFHKLKALFQNLIQDGIIADNSFVLIVNDGSCDKSWNIISDLHQKDNHFKGLDLAGNVGHQNALMAGLMAVKGKCDAAITIDVDLQDDIRCIKEMVIKFKEGYDIVYGVKTSRKGDSAIKKATATGFYKLQAAMGVQAIYNHADFRLMSSAAIGYLSEYQEKNLYLRALIPSIGCSYATVNDTISEREAGSSKYTPGKMLRLAIDGITSFSIKPIYYIVGLGISCMFISFFIIIYAIYAYFSGMTIPGWTSLMVSIWFLIGILLVCLGIVGIYIGKIYIETKKRPLYHIKETRW